MLGNLEMTVLDPPERKRVYVFPGKDLVLSDVTHLAVSASGTHRLRTADGSFWVIPMGWVGIRLDMDGWTC